MFRKEPRKICIAFSDGETNSEDVPRTKAAITRMKASGMEVYGIGIQLRDIETYLPDTSRTINNLNELTPALLELLREKLAA